MKKRFFILLTIICFNTFSQDEKDFKTITDEIDFIKIYSDSNSKDLDFYYSPHQTTELRKDDYDALSIASISEVDNFYAFSQSIYLNPECRKICYAQSSTYEGDMDDDEFFIEGESMYYFRNRVLIKKIQKTRSSSEGGEWKVVITYPNEKETYKSFQKDLKFVITNTILKGEEVYCDE